MRCLTNASSGTGQQFLRQQPAIPSSFTIAAKRSIETTSLGRGETTIPCRKALFVIPEHRFVCVHRENGMDCGFPAK